METISLSVKKEYTPDILVCGLGPAGLSASIAAARLGAKVLAVDKCAYSGGNITNANVIGVCGAVNLLTGRLITGGITAELLQATGYLRDPIDYDKMYPLSGIDIMNEVLNPPVAAEDQSAHPNAVSMIYDTELFKLQADRFLQKAGVQVLYHTFVSDVIAKDGHIEKVIISNKDGVSVVKPKYVIDGTGDADIAAWSGAPFEILPETMQAGTMMFVMGGVEYDDYAKLKVKTQAAFKQADADGVKCRYYGPGVGRLRHGVINFNMTRVPYNQTIAAQWTEAEMGARSDIEDCIKILKSYVPEFKNSYILYSGPHIGARESRRIIGEYVLTGEDIFLRKRFEDTIALGGHSIDYHDPKKFGSKAIGIKAEDLVKPYDIPYRTLVPKNVDNLLVAGRCHSVDQIAASSTRVALTASCLGEAAGVAAFMCLAGKIAPNKVNVGDLRSTLIKNNGILTVD